MAGVPASYQNCCIYFPNRMVNYRFGSVMWVICFSGIGVARNNDNTVLCRIFRFSGA